MFGQTIILAEWEKVFTTACRAVLFKLFSVWEPMLEGEAILLLVIQHL